MSANNEATRRAANDGYMHKEAFCLMWYACEECGHRERIWNSRDGVTPYGINCPSCGGGGSLRHVRFELDERAPNHVLSTHQRYFRDGTTEEAEESVHRKIKFWADTGKPIPDDAQADLLKDCRLGDKSWSWRPGWPQLDICLEHQIRVIGQ